MPCGNEPAVTGVATVNADPHQVYLGDWVVISVCDLQKLVDTSSAAQSSITLYVEGMDTFNEPVGVDLQAGTLTFVLERNQKNRNLWKPYLYDPLFDEEVSLRLSVGVRGEHPLPKTPNSNLTVRLHKIYVDWTTWAWLALLLALAIVILLSAIYTDMLRDGPPIDGVRQTYSLARTQMAWWFFLIVLSFVFIWLVTSDRDTIPPSLLGLMGISAATALAAFAIPSAAARRASKGWWRDLVTDADGSVALDRLQIVIWTIVLSGIFLTSVIWDLTMPEFSPTLLALMGISSGTYIGFKLPQKSDKAE